MNKKKYFAVAAIGALVVTGAVLSFGRDKADNIENKEETKNVQVLVENKEYTGNVSFDSIGFAQIIKDADGNIEALKKPTGSVSFNNIGFSFAMQNYSEFVSSDVTDEDVKDAQQKLDEATQTVPKDSIITGYTNLGVSNAYEYLNVRQGPSLDEKVIGKMPGYCACEILEEENGWYKIKSGDVEGYVYAELMVTGYDANVLAMENMEERLVVTTDVLNVREEPNTNCSVGTQVVNGEQLEILEDEVNGWYKININNLVGYVSAEFVEKQNVLPTAIEVKEVTDSS